MPKMHVLEVLKPFIPVKMFWLETGKSMQFSIDGRIRIILNLDNNHV